MPTKQTTVEGLNRLRSRVDSFTSSKEDLSPIAKGICDESNNFLNATIEHLDRFGSLPRGLDIYERCIEDLLHAAAEAQKLSEQMTQEAERILEEPL